MDTNLENYGFDSERYGIDVCEWLDNCNEEIVTCIIASSVIESEGEEVNRAFVQVCSDFFTASIFISVATNDH